jgi:hypothetical protein
MGQSRGKNAMRRKKTKLQSESIRADLCLGVAIAGINILIGIGLITCLCEGAQFDSGDVHENMN